MQESGDTIQEKVKENPQGCEMIPYPHKKNKTLYRRARTRLVQAGEVRDSFKNTK